MRIPISQISSMSNKKVSGTNQFVDMYLVYQFMKRITTPFKKWPAYELGIIDDKGKVLKKKSSLGTKEQTAWGYYDIVCSNLKKILAKLPGGSTRLASVAAAVFLFKEHKNIDCTNDRILTEAFVPHWKQLREEGPVAANAGSNAIAGTEPVNPTVLVKRKKRLVDMWKRKGLV